MNHSKAFHRFSHKLKFFPEATHSSDFQRLIPFPYIFLALFIYGNGRKLAASACIVRDLRLYGKFEQENCRI
ncbi:hypothetical protein ES319_D12G059400v1 [Gossypium barbadense]|uniref:Uncharacterized protein n=2 Tax=Gossypium TaxID=3633 RepID=A0A5J5NUW0_GOSBA|nr:hypothetical protein ES319_D12G059400v1 [Gossypium barbadense]TYG40043.1 hypothetical protein ES288_D12G061900v1 [Gossypium darwinii]